MKKILKILLIISSFLALTVLTSHISTSINNSEEKESEIITKKHVRDGLEISEAQVKREKKEFKKNLDYYESVESAIENNKLRSSMILKEVLKIIENDEKIIIYGVLGYDKGFEQFAVIPLLKKKDEKTGDTLYSEPWIIQREAYEKYESKGPDINNFNYNYTYFQMINFGIRDDITIPEKKNFQFFLLGTRENAESIKVNGHKPDEIIEHDVIDQSLNNQKSYFVYFNDIEMSGGYDDMEITFE